MTRKARLSPDGNRIEIYEALKYADGLEDEVVHEVIQPLAHAGMTRQEVYDAHFPYQTLALIDHMVGYIAEHCHKSPSFMGAKFKLVEYRSSDDPFDDSTYEIFEPSPLAVDFFARLRAFHALLCNAEYHSSRYCVSIEAARKALLFAYRHGFIELPSENPACPEGVPEWEFRRVIAQRARPAIECYNQAIQKIAQIVTASDYRSRQARELSKLKSRVSSVTSLINGLLNHHTRLTVVALRLSVRQASALDFLGERVQTAFERLIGDRRNDLHLKSAIGYFWVRQESLRVSLRRRMTTPGQQGVNGDIALHYDLVLFFDVHYRDVNAITEHLREKWKKSTDGAGYCRSLSRKRLNPYFSRYLSQRMEQVGRIPDDEDFVGVVTRGSIRASNLLAASRAMVTAAVLRKQEKHGASPTLIHNKARRFGKSDLLTGCGYTKEGRGTKQGMSGQKYERKKRPLSP